MVKVEQKILIEVGGQKLAITKQEAEQFLDELKRELTPPRRFDPKQVEAMRQQYEHDKKIGSDPPYREEYTPFDRTGINPIPPYVVTC